VLEALLNGHGNATSPIDWLRCPGNQRIHDAVHYAWVIPC